MILLPSVSSVYSFFFLCFYDFFSFGLQKELFFQIVICRFLLCEIASFCLFFFDEGDFNDSILFVDVLQISSFWGVDCWNFPLFISSNDVRWGRNWGCRVVRDVDVRDNFRAMCRIISWNIWKCLSHLFCNSSCHFLKLMFEFLMNNFSCFCLVNFRNDDFVVSEWCNGFFPLFLIRCFRKCIRCFLDIVRCILVILWWLFE